MNCLFFGVDENQSDEQYYYIVYMKAQAEEAVCFEPRRHRELAPNHLTRRRFQHCHDSD
ncbi:hypothetical protein RvVAT039_pl06390 (plasmid) [Agrobacterium vitis]|nr:hypothetical protein RvVAT039_pl06390 [Agrobacterium vitis]